MLNAASKRGQFNVRGCKFACAPFSLRVLCAGVKSLNLLLCKVSWLLLLLLLEARTKWLYAQRCHKLILRQVPLCLGRKSSRRATKQGNNTQSTGGIQSAKLTGPELLCPPL